MLEDIERKLLRILFNFSSTCRRMPTMPELQRKMGRRKGDIYTALRELVEKEFILWPDNPKLETIVILQPWEPGQEMKTIKPNSRNNIDYYLYY